MSYRFDSSMSNAVRSLIVAIAMISVSVPASVRAQNAANGHVVTVPEPANLGIMQDSVRAYIKSGEYERGIADVIDSARAFLASRYQSVSHPAIVLDIDETSLSNLRFELRYNFGFEGALWEAWVKKSEATAIKPTLELAKWASSHHIAIFFVTGRGRISQDLADDPTVINLKKAGYPAWTGLYFKDHHKRMTTIEYKTAARKAITAKGYTIIDNIGDQYSDLKGGYSEAEFKLPDPMYYIP